MSKYNLRIILVFMAIALVGLISFQFYWIRNAISLGEQRFKQDVLEAMNTVATQLERNEVRDVAFNNFKSKFSFSGLVDVNEDSVEYIESSFEKKVLPRNFIILDDAQEQPEVRLHFETDMANNIIGVEVQNEVQPKLMNREGVVVYGDSLQVLEMNFAELNKQNKQITENIKKVVRKTEMVNTVLYELLMHEKQLSERVAMEDMRKLLNAEFADRGIDLDYEYAIADAEGRVSMRLASYNEDLFDASATYRVNLFPNDVLDTSATLLVFFPNKDSYLFRQIWLSLLSSVLLIGTILFCFAISLQTIVKQKKLSEMKNDFINNMTHEFKTPIATISFAVANIENERVIDQPAQVRKFTHIIKEENKRMNGQVEQVLRAAVADRKAFKFKPESFNLHETINSLSDSFDMQVRALGGNLKRVLNASAAQVYGDPFHLANAIANLLDNAIKYSGSTPEVSISTSSDKAGLYVRVTDNGIGMSSDEQKRVFDQFYRVPTGNLHNIKGFGLGLSYVKAVVEQHQGEVGLQSKPGKGSTFTLYLPYNNPQAHD